MANVWLIRNDVFDEELEEGGFISIGWPHVPDLNTLPLNRESIARHLREVSPNASVQSLGAQAGTLRRFYRDVQIGDVVVAPRPSSNLLRIGKVTGDYFHTDDPEHPHRRNVEWVITDLRRDLLPDDVRLGLRNISTLSLIRRRPEFFKKLAEDPDSAPELVTDEDQGPGTWIVGANIDGEDRTQEFVTSGVWRLAEGLDDRARLMKKGDRIAIKIAGNKKSDVPFDNRGLYVSFMRIKARGEITGVAADHVNVSWDKEFTEREWYFYTFFVAVQKLRPSHRHTAALERFIFDGEDQDIAKFLANPFWGRYTEDVEASASAHPSFKVARPTAGPIYAAATKWKESLLAGTSLFSASPLNYRQAASALVNDFVNQPLIGEGSFTGKLTEQLKSSPDSALQLAAELLFVYSLPMHHSSMGQSAKISLIKTVTSWRDTLTHLPEDLEPALLSGVARVGTAYQTFRWKIFQYLILLIQEFTTLGPEEKEAALTDLTGFRAFTSQVDDQSVWSMRFLLEHLLFPDEAINASSRDDRYQMRKAMAEKGAPANLNELFAQMAPNIHYGHSLEINPYATPLRFEWQRLSQQARTWGEWGALVLEDLTGDDESGAPATEPSDPLEELEILSSGAGDALRNWYPQHKSEVTRLLGEIPEMGLSWVVDQIASKLDWQGKPAELIEASTTLLASLASQVPIVNEEIIEVLIDRLGALGLSPRPSPGELMLAVLEALDTFGVALRETHGMDLRRDDLAYLAQATYELDPALTSWPMTTQERFLDWRDGRAVVGPEVELDIGEESEPVSPTEPAEPIEEPEADVPRDLATLAQMINFDHDAGGDWLKDTRELLHEKGQIILQGPPGTGKTFIAQKLALFLAEHSSRVHLVQFHPATTYEDFIEGLRPKIDGSGGFEVSPGPLRKIAEQARANPTKQHILIIDEINRANLPAVFGELYFLLEYRDQEITLNYGGDFSLPSNLLIIGTMNTADRSIASIDAALRRRFYIQDLRPENQELKEALHRWLDKNAPHLTWLNELLEITNELIGDPDQSIGPSHFFQPDLTEEKVLHAWNHTVLPTLREYFYGQVDRFEEFQFEELKAKALKLNTDAEAD